MESAQTAVQTCNTDAELVQAAARGDHAAFEALMRTHNRQLFRVARAILKDDADAEEALQEAYITAYTRLAAFRGESKLATWLTRIVINESLGRLRKQKKHEVVVPFSPDVERERDEQDLLSSAGNASPEMAAMRAEMRAVLEQKIDELPLDFRTVFMMREVEEMTVEETAHCLGIPEPTVRTRLFRARALLRESIAREIDTATPDVFAFAGARCDRIVGIVMERLFPRGKLQ
jgi:RNA polymerase sigma-70 factor, ECF subfamily